MPHNGGFFMMKPDKTHGVDILGVTINSVTMQESVETIRTALRQEHPLRVVTANPEMLVRSEKDAELREILNQADLVVPDGEGVVWAARYLGASMLERVTGIDLTLLLLEQAETNGWRVFFLGGKPGVADEAAAKVRQDFPKLSIQAHHGFFAVGQEEEKVLTFVRGFSPHILLAGMGQPRQEYWLSRYPDLAGVSMGVGGTFDVLSGHSKRAPRWIRRIRLEWLYRLVQEPKRLKRQLTLPLYMLKVGRQRARIKRGEARSKKSETV